jgi:hypothetical protein
MRSVWHGVGGLGNPPIDQCCLSVQQLPRNDHIEKKIINNTNQKCRNSEVHDDHLVSLSLRNLSACFRDLSLPLQVPLVRLFLPELCCQLGVIGIPQEQT